MSSQVPADRDLEIQQLREALQFVTDQKGEADARIKMILEEIDSLVKMLTMLQVKLYIAYTHRTCTHTPCRLALQHTPL